jgi:hypothetical protein
VPHRHGVAASDDAYSVHHECCRYSGRSTEFRPVKPGDMYVPAPHHGNAGGGPKVMEYNEMQPGEPHQVDAEMVTLPSSLTKE